MRKIKFFIVSWSLILTGISLTTSCNKDKEIFNAKNTSVTSSKLVGVANCNATVKNGYLVFESYKDLYAYSKFLESSNDSEIDKIEIKNNFMSYDRKIANILREYEVLNENRNTTMQEILSFRKQYEKYITITDEDFFLKIEGTSNRIVNSEGYMQLENRIQKHTEKNIYTTLEANVSLLKSSSYSNELVDKTVVKIHILNSNEVNSNTENLSQGSNLSRTWKQKCGRWHETVFTIGYVSQTYVYGGKSTVPPPGHPHYASTSFVVRVKHRKRGWTGIWYPHSRYSRHQGYYHAEHEPFRTFDVISNSSFTSKVYELRGKHFTSHWSAQNYLNAVNWYSWGYIAGTLTYDLCGTKTFSY